MTSGYSYTSLVVIEQVCVTVITYELVCQLAYLCRCDCRLTCLQLSRLASEERLLPIEQTCAAVFTCWSVCNCYTR